MTGSAVVFALEVVVDHVTVQHAQSTSNASSNDLRPALGIRFLDLPAVVIDAPDGQGFPIAEGHIPFHGRGKALLFELPQTVVETNSHVPLPLWLTTLARPKHAVRPEQAFLVASACLDMRKEAASAAVGRPSTLDSPVPYRACNISMTSARGVSGALGLQCRLRIFQVYHDHQMRNGISPGETRLEHQAVIESVQHPAALKTTSAVDGSVAAVGNSASAVSVAVQANCMESVSTQTDEQPAYAAPSSSGCNLETTKPVADTWADLAAAGGEQQSPSLHLPGEVRIGRVNFPKEIHVLPLAMGGHALPLEVGANAMSQPSVAPGKYAMPQPGVAPASSAVSKVASRESSLPLIAKLTQELCQLQGAALVAK